MPELKGIFFIFLMILLAGCSRLEEVLVLKRVGDSQKQIQKYLQRQDILFEKLLRDVKTKRLKPGISKTKVMARYGDPVVSLAAAEALEQEILLYRYSRNYFNSDKVYLYFNQSNQLIRWEHKLSLE